MSVMAQAADAANPFAEFLSVGGPVSGVLAAVGFLTKMWLDSRKEKREDTASERQSESGIVETTRAALELVRKEMLSMGQDIAVLRAQVQDRDMQIEKLQDIVRTQAAEIAVLRAELNRKRGG
jgi:chromosome segregation ATPase